MTSLVFLDTLSATSVGGFPSALQHGIVTIGNFDGVHRGHQALLLQCQNLARQMADSTVDIPLIAVTFDPHPTTLLRPKCASVPLSLIQTRADRMSQLGVEALVVCRTTPELLDLSPREFFQRLVVDDLQAAGVVEGANFYFGKDRVGDIEMMERLCQDHFIGFQVAQSTDSDGEMISSSRMRSCLSHGNVRGFAQLCGHRHRVEGTVQKGAQRGRTLGFPTANLGQIDVMVPANGVYAGFAILEEILHPAAIHIGPNPTFDEKTGAKVEIHLIDYDGDLYGKPLAVEFVDRVRRVVPFDTASELIAQLQRDIEWVRKRTATAG